MSLFSAFLGGWVQPADVFVQFYANEDYSFWLDGEFSPTDRFSILGAGFPLSEHDAIEPALSRYSGEAKLDLPFKWRPGLVGFLTYEGARNFILADRAIVFDHEEQGIYFIGQFDSVEEFDFWHHAALLRLGLSGGQVATYLHRAQSEGIAPTRLRDSADEYLVKIKQAQKHISAGDIYQLCLTNQISVETDRKPLSVCLTLRESNPAPYSAFIQFGTSSLVSSSPEQFIQVRSDGKISSKPIKGTRPRGIDEIADARIADELRSDSKERAENLMIVDLMRNDIGKVAAVGSVEVSKLFDVESYSTVHQLVSTVSGHLADGETAWSAVQAAFPGGSMTGAPKIRAMQLIHELEKAPRGAYSGCVGYLAGGGSAEFAMVIRSILFENGLANIGVGGGITIDSDPAAELEETKLKAKALLAALNAADPWA